MTSGGCSQCEILTEVNRYLEVRMLDDRATAIARLFASGVPTSTIAHAFRLPPETIEAIVRARPGGAP